MKFQRIFQALIQGQQIAIPHSIASPLTVRFDIDQRPFSSASSGKFTFYNLSQAVRRDIFFDSFDLTALAGDAEAAYRSVVFQAGYLSQPRLPVIFRGNIYMAWSKREGANQITTVDALDGGFGIVNSQVAITKPPTSFKDVASAALATMQKVSIGAVADLLLPKSVRGVTLMGNTWDELQQLVQPPNQLFIAQETANILDPNSYIITGTVPVIQSSSGLLNTPRKQGSTIFVTTLLNSDFKVGQLAVLNSSETWMNGTYKVSGLHHYGTISEMQGENAYTDIELFAGDGTGPLKAVSTLSREMGVAA